VLVVMGILLVKAFTLPITDIPVIMAFLCGGVVVTLVKNIEFGKIFFFFFALLGVICLVVYRIPRNWLILTVTALFLSYELLEFFFLHNTVVGDEEQHQTLMRRHALYLGVIFSAVMGLSFGVLFFFEKISFRFSESIYINALIFSVAFLAVLYILRYASS